MKIFVLFALLQAAALPALGQSSPDGQATPWSCREVRDRMEDRVYHSLTVISLPVELSSPARTARLYFGSLSNAGSGASLYLTQGLFNCGTGRDSCSVRFRFDDNPPVRVNGRSSHPYRLLVLEGTEMLERAKGAKSVLVEVPVFSNGYRVFEFFPTGDSSCPRAAAVAEPAASQAPR